MNDHPNPIPLHSGELDAVVEMHPPLPGGREKHLLRAMLAFVKGDTALTLAGLLEIDEDAAEVRQR